jgi:hypothetical protein
VENQFNLLTITRQNILNTIKNLDLEQVNFIPNNFNNSIGWQISHLLVTQQLLHYKLSGNDPYITKKSIEHYGKGSSGNRQLNNHEWGKTLSDFLSFPKQLEKDYKSDLFKTYQTYTTSYNATLNNIEEAIVFNNIHEAMHFGIIMSMKKCLTELY